MGELLRPLPAARLVHGSPDTPIGGIAFDSRRVQPGDLFVAMPGLVNDGRAFAAQAAERGAAAVVAQSPLPDVTGPALVEVPSARPALADLAAAFHDDPSSRLTLVGVTGTDGKTSVTQLISAVLEAGGRRTAWLTTVDLKIGEERRLNAYSHTTPEAVGVQGFLAEAADAGADVAVLETSSHALAQDRVRGCQFDVAVFTNLSPEHLNYHGTLEAYRDAKAHLFAMLGEPTSKRGPRTGIVNADDPASAAMRAACPQPVLSYGVRQPSDVRATDLELHERGAIFTLQTPTGAARVSTRLLGRFNVLNWLAAATVGHALGIGPELVATAASALPPVRGRMEPVEAGQPFSVIVDFAHTPQALANALQTVRQHTRGRVLLAFGLAGERDPASRPVMGRLAAEMADFFAITTDDPLFEDPADIAAAIAAGAQAAGATEGERFAIQLDRREAIRTLLERAEPGDCVLLAGKGHEPRMLVRDQRLPWDDRAAALELLETLNRSAR
ncbi:MAG: UDP-N-acetylmuramoyl-L-alanyl-D-glutamate--2,6-diaminopimelate ligase [Chloroflexi bacterium]|nr:UDP-N-acetylmuramoyl-L-alanyl-D-glutamate--2,6-diaminopimelate ligase [Chloroflexota bacterium]